MFGWEVIRKGVDLIVTADSDGTLPPCKIQIIGQGCLSAVFAGSSNRAYLVQQASQ